MRALARTLLLSTCLASAFSAASADMRDLSVELGVFTGAYDLREDDTDADTRSNVSGLRVGLAITEEHEVEFVYDAVEVEFAGLNVEDIDSWSLRYLFNWNYGAQGRIVPYAGAGLGSVDDDVFDVFEVFSDDDTQLTFFGGLRLFAGRNFALRSELDYKTFSTFGVDQTVFEVTAGLSWVVGGR